MFLSTAVINRSSKDLLNIIFSVVSSILRFFNSLVYSQSNRTAKENVLVIFFFSHLYILIISFFFLFLVGVPLRRGNKGVLRRVKEKGKLKGRQENESALSDKQWANYQVTGCFDPITVIIIPVRGKRVLRVFFGEYFNSLDVNYLAPARASVYEVPYFISILTKFSGLFLANRCIDEK